MSPAEWSKGAVMAKIFCPKTAREAVELRKANRDTAVYLAGGTEALRLGSPCEGKDLIDLSELGLDEIFEKDGKIWIGARCSLQQMAESELLPGFLREAAGFCSSLVRRLSATVGGNLGARRPDDGYLAAALTAAEATLLCETPHGDKTMSAAEYLTSDCVCLIRTVLVDKGRTGWVRRFGNTAASHAALIAAESEGICAATISGSGLVYMAKEFKSPKACCHSSAAEEPAPSAYQTKEAFLQALAGMDYVNDLTGSAEYKKYLATTVFAEGGASK